MMPVTERRDSMWGPSRRAASTVTEGGAGMADLIAIGYPDETTALAAMDEAEQLQQELIIQADAVAAIIRNKEGKIRVVTNHHAVGAGATWGMFWGMLFGALFLVVEKVTPDKAVEAMSKFGGTVLKSSLSNEAQQELQEALHGEGASA